MKLFLVTQFFVQLMVAFCTVTQAFAVGPFSIEVQKGDRVRIKGFRGDVTYVVKEAAPQLTVQITNAKKEMDDNWQFSMRRQDDAILVMVDGPQSKQAWADMMADSKLQPVLNLTIVGPSLPLQLNWQEGKFSTRDLKAEALVNLLAGEVDIQGGEGAIRVDAQKGLVKILKHQGSVDVDTYEARVEVGESRGDVTVNNFIGATRVTQMEGALSLLSYKGDTRISRVKGSLAFKNGNSPLHIENLRGDLRGRSMQGPVYASIEGEANVRVESEEGPVNLRMPGSGAWVNLATEEGSLQVPSFLKLTRLPSRKIRTGKLRGDYGGHIFVRTTSGDIRLR